MVTRPAVPPYSSTTMAICWRPACSSRSSSDTRFVSGSGVGVAPPRPLAGLLVLVPAREGLAHPAQQPVGGLGEREERIVNQRRGPQAHLERLLRIDQHDRPCAELLDEEREDGGHP